MNNFPSRETVEAIRKCYPIGCHVKLVKMDDSQAPPLSTKGVVVGVDDMASVMVQWANGSNLNVVFEVDEIVKTEE